jgi:putative salt-induced outer membrane protein
MMRMVFLLMLAIASGPALAQPVLPPPLVTVPPPRRTPAPPPLTREELDALQEKAPIPDAVDAMIEAARADPAKLAVIAEMARKAFPDAAPTINARVALINAERAAQREAQLAEQTFFQGWTGSGELGAFASSGNTSTQGVSAGLNLVKRTRSWQHSLRGFVDYQRQEGVTTRERYLATYQGNYNIGPRAFSLIGIGFEKDEFSGFEYRVTQSLGLGYRLFTGPGFIASLEAGPSLRQTRFTTGNTEATFAGRAAADLRWNITERINLREAASYYYDGQNNSFQSLTSFDARINGALTARLSHQINTESNPPAGRRRQDQVSRTTLVYSF